MRNRRPIEFSVIIPVFNRANLARRAIVSVLNQTLQDFEIVIVDDGSSDNLYDVVINLSDERIIMIKQENNGPGAARNRGIEIARGEYIAFLDSDDIFLEDHLLEMRSILGKSRSVVAYSQVLVKRNDGQMFLKPPRPIRDGESMATYLMCDKGFVQTSSVALSRANAIAVKYREDARFGDDTDFAVRLQLHGLHFVMAPKPSVIWFDDDLHVRVSSGRPKLWDFKWFDDLRGKIPEKAYYGYRGWHVAKSVAISNPLRALRLFLFALFNGSYPPSLAVIVFLQIFLPREKYRLMANCWLSLIKAEFDQNPTRNSRDCKLKP